MLYVLVHIILIFLAHKLASNLRPKLSQRTLLLIPLDRLLYNYCIDFCRKPSIISCIGFLTRGFNVHLPVYAVLLCKGPQLLGA